MAWWQHLCQSIGCLALPFCWLRLRCMPTTGRSAPTQHGTHCRQSACTAGGSAFAAGTASHNHQCMPLCQQSLTRGLVRRFIPVLLLQDGGAACDEQEVQQPSAVASLAVLMDGERLPTGRHLGIPEVPNSPVGLSLMHTTQASPCGRCLHALQILLASAKSASLRGLSHCMSHCTVQLGVFVWAAGSQELLWDMFLCSVSWLWVFSMTQR